MEEEKGLTTLLLKQIKLQLDSISTDEILKGLIEEVGYFTVYDKIMFLYDEEYE